MALTAGTILGQYEIRSPLGAGGMGEVYRARDARLDREVAIKVLPESLTSDPDRLRRFEQEARAAAALNHPNILAVYQMATHEAVSYMVTELLEGETLRERLRRGTIPLRKAIDYAVQIAHGLAAAHEKGIVHRDLKPENLFVTKDGRVKILDFGLAKLTQPRDSSDVEPTLTEATEPGVVMGTVGYMSPEQVRGKTADHRSDIFAFGTILYEMLTGKQSFRKPTSAETMTAILNEEPPSISQLAPTTPPGLQRVVHRCLEKNPEQRFHSAHDLAFALEALSDSGSAATRAIAPASARRKWTWAAGILAFGALAIGGYLRRPSRAAMPGASSPSLAVRSLTESGNAVRSTVTPDGRYVAYVNRESGKYELRLLQVATERDVQLLPGSPQRIRSLHFSPDGNFLYFLRVLDPAKDPDTSGVFRIAMLGGLATPLAMDARTGDARPNSVTVSPDGKQIAYIAQAGNESLIVSIDPDGGNRRVLAKRPAGFGFWFVEWSPSPDKLAAIAIGKDDMGLVRIDLASGSIQDLSVSGWGALGQPVWSPDGETIFAPGVAGERAMMQIWAFDARTGTHRPLTSSSTAFSQWNLSATYSGDLVANTISADTSLWVTDHSAQPHSIPSIKGEGEDGVVWVDGRIVTSNIWEMIVHDPDGQNPTKLRSYSSIYRQLTRCGPGRVAYWATDDKRRSHVARTDITTGSTMALTGGPADGSPTCTMDGSTLVFGGCTDNHSRCSIIRKSLDSGQSLALYEFDPAKENLHSPTISPNGESVLLSRQLDGGDPHEWAMIIPISGGAPKMQKMPISAGDMNGFEWSPDGKSIIYSRNDENGVGNVWSAPINGGAPRKVTNFNFERIFGFDVLPDNRLVLSRGNWAMDVVLIKNVK